MSFPQASLKDTFDKWDESLFSGRDKEIALFDDLLSRTSRQTSIVAISGILGIGKSALVRAYARRAMLNGALIAITNGDDASSPIAILLELSTQLSRDNDSKKHFSDFFSKVERLRAIENQVRKKVQEDENTAGKVAVEAVKGGALIICRCTVNLLQLGLKVRRV